MEQRSPRSPFCRNSRRNLLSSLFLQQRKMGRWRRLDSLRFNRNFSRKRNLRLYRIVSRKLHRNFLQHSSPCQKRPQPNSVRPISNYRPGCYLSLCPKPEFAIFDHLVKQNQSSKLNSTRPPRVQDSISFSNQVASNKIYIRLYSQNAICKSTKKPEGFFYFSAVRL